MGIDDFTYCSRGRHFDRLCSSAAEPSVCTHSARQSASPVLSIVTVNKNNAEGVKRTIKSLATLRSVPGLEFIFVDGASTDDSLASARHFYRPGEIFSRPDRGIYQAMNIGLRRASGKYVLWVNSGDELVPEAMQYVVAQAMSRDDDCLSFRTMVIETAGTIDIHDADMNRLPSSTLPHPSTLFNRRTALSLGGYDETYRIAGDRDLILRIFFLPGATFKCDKTITAIFYGGGISSRGGLYLEDLRVNYKHGLINLRAYVVAQAKHRIKTAICSWTH